MMMRHGMIREHSYSLSIFARVVDVVGIIICGILAWVGRFGYTPISVSYQIALLLSILLVALGFPLFGIYHSWRGRSWLNQVRVLTGAWVSILIVLIIIAFLTKTSAIFSRQWMIAWAVFGWVFLLCFRVALHFVLRILRERGWNRKRILIIGAGQLGGEVARRISESPWTGLDVIGFLDDNEKKYGEIIEGVRVIGGIDGANSKVDLNNISEIWIALPLRAEKRVKELLYQLRHNTVTIRFVPDIFGFRLINHSVTGIAGIPVMDLSITPMIGINRMVKAIEDRVLGLIILILIAPILMLLSVGVKLSSPGPILFKQMRHGWDGKPIKVYKFRSMVVHDEEEAQVKQATKDDVRTTKFGRFLRRTSLDEMPQFFNVVQGRMSIVGPRPHPIALNDKHKDLIDAYMQRHKVKPGITGWAQINGWRGETDTLEKMKKRVEYDLYYIENWSLWFDLKIIALTLFKGFLSKHAY